MQKLLGLSEQTVQLTLWIGWKASLSAVSLGAATLVPTRWSLSGAPLLLDLNKIRWDRDKREKQLQQQSCGISMMLIASLPPSPEEAGEWQATLTDTAEVELRRLASQLADLETGEPRGIWPYKQWSLSYKPRELLSLSEQQEGIKRTLSSHDKCLKPSWTVCRPSCKSSKGSAAWLTSWGEQSLCNGKEGAWWWQSMPPEKQ